MTLSTLGHFINGTPVADTARTQPVYNPATGQVVRNVALASRQTVEGAIAAAAAAFPAWRAVVGPFFAAPPVVEHFDLVAQSA